MKNRNLPLAFTYVALTFCLITIAGCAKKGDDLTTAVIGKYVGGSGANRIEIAVARVDNSIILLSFTSDSSSSRHSTTMESASTFTLNEVTELNNKANKRLVANGTGEFKGDSIVVMRHEIVYQNSTGALVSETDRRYAGKKR